MTTIPFRFVNKIFVHFTTYYLELGSKSSFHKFISEEQHIWNNLHTYVEDSHLAIGKNNYSFW
jgi:hypothetical protein